MSLERSVFVTRGHCCADCCWPHGDYPPQGVCIVGPETQNFTFTYPPAAPQQGAETHPCRSPHFGRTARPPRNPSSIPRHFFPVQSDPSAVTWHMFNTHIILIFFFYHFVFNQTLENEQWITICINSYTNPQSTCIQSIHPQPCKILSHFMTYL